MIYLASPYWHEDPEVREKRFRVACAAAGEMMRGGLYVFSPIAHSVSIEKHGQLTYDDSTGHDFWLNQDLHMLSIADEFFILMLPGWRESKGIAQEIDHAEATGLLPIYVEPDFVVPNWESI